MNDPKSSKWGSGLFENQWDLDIIRGFTVETEIGKKTMNTFLFPEDVKEWRKQLDAGALDKLLDKYLPFTGGTEDSAEKFNAVAPHDYDKSPDYCLCVIGAVMMHLGCKIRPDFRQFLEENHRNAGFSRNAAIQLGQALEVYEEGIPHNFRFKKTPASFYEAKDTSPQDHLWQQFAATQFKFGTEQDPQTLGLMRVAVSQLIKTCLAGETVHPPHVCGNCGRDRAEDGSALRVCSDCNVKLYCSRKCELTHRPTHKIICDDHIYRAIGERIKEASSGFELVTTVNVADGGKSFKCLKCDTESTKGVACRCKKALYCNTNCLTAHVLTHIMECEAVHKKGWQKLQRAVKRAAKVSRGSLVDEKVDGDAKASEKKSA